MIFAGSRYARTDVLVTTGPDGTPRRALARRAVPPAPGVAEHVVMAGERLDHLAARFYGDPRRAWLLLDANPEELDPFLLLRPGRRIRVPRDGTVPR